MSAMRKRRKWPSRTLCLIVCVLVAVVWNEPAWARHGEAGNHKRKRHRHHSMGSGYSNPRAFNADGVREEDTFTPSVLEFEKIGTGYPDNAISVVSLVNEVSAQETKWYVPSFHDRYSAGWNRTAANSYGNAPYACHLRMYAVGMEDKLKSFLKGGSAELRLQYTVGPNSKRPKEQFTGYGEEAHGIGKIFCYYQTNKHRGSDFRDSPKTLGIAIYCPITLDMEVGEFFAKAIQHSGKVCKPVTNDKVKFELVLAESSAVVKEPFPEKGYLKDFRTVKTTFTSGPSAHRALHQREEAYESELVAGPPNLSTGMSAGARVGRTPGGSGSDGDMLWQGFHAARPHAVCAVQTFQNPGTGPMLYMFVQYWYRVGWGVVVYDRYGMHRDFIKDMLHWPGFYYHPYTVYSITQPGKYTVQLQEAAGNENKVYYAIEKNWGYSGKQVSDTADQDGDKTKTYDFARMEYPQLTTLLYVDIDELLLCPQANSSMSAQRQFQRQIMDTFSAQGVQEMRFVRLPYAAKAPADPSKQYDPEKPGTVAEYSSFAQECMKEGYENRDALAILSCWSSATAYDNFYKSADMAGVCPFHYNHWSCDGMRGGGRDWGDHATTPRCRCKVGFEMMNGYSYQPYLDKCHLLHLHHAKYRFQSGRQKHRHDDGHITEISPVARFVANAIHVDNQNAERAARAGAP